MFYNDRSNLQRLPAAQTIRHQRLTMHPPRPLPEVVWTSPTARAMHWLRRVLLRR